MKETPKPSAQLVSELVRIVTAGAVLAGCKPMVEITPTINQDPTKENPSNTLVVPEIIETSETALIQLPVGSEPTASPTAEPVPEATPTEVLQSQTVPLRPAGEVAELAGITFNIDGIKQLYPNLTAVELLAATNGMQGDAMRYTAVIQAVDGDKPVLVMPISITQDGKEYEANYPSYFDAKAGGVLTARMNGVTYSLIGIDGNKPVSIYWNQEYPNVGQTDGGVENSVWEKVELVDKSEWPFPEDPVVESIKLTEDEMKEKNTEFYNEVAPILSGSGIVVEQWMQHPDTGEVFMLVHHKDGGGQFMMTDYEYSNGHVLFGFNTRETGIMMENKWLQPADDGRLLAITLQNAPDGKTMNSLFMDLAGMAHLRNRVGLGNLPGTLENMKAAIAAERATLGNDRINFVYLLTIFKGGETLATNPFPEMHTYLGSSGPGDAVKTDIILINNVDGSLIVMNGMQVNRDSYEATAVFLRGEKTVTRVKNNEELKNKFARMPDLPQYLLMESIIYGDILGTTIANLGEKSMELTALGTYANKFLAEPISTNDYSLVDVSTDSFNAYFRGETDDLPEKYVQNLIEWVNHIFIRNQLVK